MTVAIILGTRPEIVKMSPVIRAARDRGSPFLILHTGQHYSHDMDRVFFERLELPDADHNLDVGSGSHGEQTARMLAGIERVLQETQPTTVLVQGDTNTVVAGALAAAKLHIPVGHVEAGLRSYDRRMPEEINRVVADHVADLLFAPTDKAADILRGEGLPESRIHVTGNTIVDAVLVNKDLAQRTSDVLERWGLDADGYVLMTAHRQENVDDPARFAGILDGARRAGRALDVPVVYPAHPRARKNLAASGLDAEGILLKDPVDFLDFLVLESQARLLVTDSGGVQEEGCILQVPCVTVRDSTERPETLDVGANVLAGADADRIEAAAREMATRPRDWTNPFGDGAAGKRILDIMERSL